MKALRKSAAITAASATALAAVISYLNVPTSDPVWVDRPLVECEQIIDEINDAVGDVEQVQFCFKQKDYPRYHILTELRLDDEMIPVAIGLNSGGSLNPDRAFVHVVGGPGTQISLEFGSIALFETIEACGAITITPIYSGSYERSAYPMPSSDMAESEVGKLISHLLDKGQRVNIIASSLGGHIISSKKVPISGERHLLISPMLVSPAEIVEVFENRIDQRGVFSERIIQQDGVPTKTMVPLIDFQTSYFVRNQAQRSDDFLDRWRAKDNVNEGAQVDVLIAEQEDRAGGIEYAGRLRGLGFNVHMVSGNHHGGSASERAEREAAIREFGEKVCSPSGGRKGEGLHFPLHSGG